jgi:hypothetical protein
MNKIYQILRLNAILLTLIAAPIVGAIGAVSAISLAIAKISNVSFYIVVTDTISLFFMAFLSIIFLVVEFICIGDNKSNSNSNNK